MDARPSDRSSWIPAFGYSWLYPILVGMRDRVLAVWRAGVFLLRGAVTGLVSLVALIPLLFFGMVATRSALRLLHDWTSYERRRVATFTGKPIHEVPPPDGTLIEQLRASRREIAWLAGHAVSGSVVGLLGATLPLAAINAALVPFYWWLAPADDPIASPYPVTSWTGAAFMPLLAVAYATASLWVTPWLARQQTRWARWLLSPPPGAELAVRVAELTASRAAALEAHGAELRRIERDLHDDTQNRIVAVAMHLGIIERALRRDPASALPLILKAQDAASDALAGLRGVVRSIYPPVLAERGLDGAIAGLIARAAVPTTLSVTDVRRAPAAVESAAYFVVAEAMTNVAKHSGANRCEVRLTGPDPLVLEVWDDGHGGADEAGGTGLLGIQRRVAAFDGKASIISPDGGPTLLKVELPCGQ